MKIVFTSCLLAAFAALMAGCHGNEPTSPAAVQTAQARVVESQQQQVPLNMRATGTVHARETAVVSAQVVGRIQQVLVREGDSVRAGQTLVVLDDAALRASAEQAQAGVKAAQDEQAAAQTDAKLAASTLDRYRQLQAEKSVSPQEMDEVAQRAEASSARLEAVRAQTECGACPGERRTHNARLYPSGGALCRRGDGADGRSRDTGLAGRAFASGGPGWSAATRSHGG